MSGRNLPSRHSSLQMAIKKCLSRIGAQSAIWRSGARACEQETADGIPRANHLAVAQKTSAKMEPW